MRRWRRSLSARPGNPHPDRCQLDRKDRVQFQRRRRLATTNHRVIFFFPRFPVLLRLLFPWPPRRDFVRPFRTMATGACADKARVLKRKEIKVNILFPSARTARVRRAKKKKKNCTSEKNRAMINNKISRGGGGDVVLDNHCNDIYIYIRKPSSEHVYTSSIYY